MSVSVEAFHFCSGNNNLLGMLHHSSDAADPATRGVIVVVGGPQYRIGSHRQFVLLARNLAEHGIPTLRFDYQGMGDSEGEDANFESISSDISSAVDVFFQKLPQMQDVVIWGLCDAASASIFYSHSDPRIAGLILLNPWVRTEQGIAKTYLKHYYLSRLFDRSLWVKLISGKFNFTASLMSLVSMLKSLFFKDRAQSDSSGNSSDSDNPESSAPATISNDDLPDRMLTSFKKFRGRSLFILSGEDYTADEFRDLIHNSRSWKKLLKTSNVEIQELAGANHTFAKRIWRDQVAKWSVDWVRSL